MQKIKNYSRLLGGGALVSCVLLILTGCQIDQGRGSSKDKIDAKNSPAVSVENVGSEGTGEITSWAANVVVTQKNSRSVGGNQEVQRYAVKTKLINGRVVSRLDFPGEVRTSARTVVSDGSSTVLADANSGAILHRTTTPKPDGWESTVPQRLLGRVSISDVVATAQRLSYDIATEESGRWVTLSVPATKLSSLRVGLESTPPLKEFRILFDTIDETVASTIQVQELPDGEVVTTTTTNQYQMYEGQPIMVGQIIEEEHLVPGTLPLGPDALPASLDLETMEEVSSAQLEEMAKSSLVVDLDVPLGDRTDPSYTVSTFINYSDIQLNGVAEADMRLLLEDQP